jgi:UMF1 family MFS transporter
MDFAQVTFYYLPNNVFHKSPRDYIFKGFKELGVVLKNKSTISLKQFLTAFFYIVLEFKRLYC